MSSLQTPVAPYRHERSHSHAASIETMATADLASSHPVKSQSYNNFNDDDEYHSRSGAASPYRDHDGGDQSHQQYQSSQPQQPQRFGGQVPPPMGHPSQQVYHQVQPR